MMGKTEKIFERVLSGTSDNNIKFEDLKSLLIHLGFNQRIKGSHHIYYKNGLEEIVNIQPTDSKAKPYQVKQIRKIILKYNLELV